jgi:ribosome maturation factor RimP
MASTSGGPKGSAAFLLIGRPSLRGKTAEDRKLLDLLDPVAEATGYDIVRLRLMGGDHRRNLQIMAERPDGTMLVEDCSALARAVSEVLDAADPIRGEYTLEVSSPGVDRPLTRLKDFETYEGFEARIELDRLAENRKRFKGRLAGVDGRSIGIDMDGEDETALVPFAWITEAKLVITDALMKRGADARAARVAAEAAAPPPTSPPPARTREEDRAESAADGADPAKPKNRGPRPPAAHGPRAASPVRGRRTKRMRN